MYSISLLPSEYRNLKASARKKELSVLVMATIVIAFAIIFVTISVIASTYDSNLESLQNENASLERRIREYQYIEVLQSEVSALQSQVLQIAGSSVDWSIIIREIGNSVPPQISLSSLVITFPDTFGLMIIQGNAASHDTVAAWMERLKEIQGLSGLQFKLSEIDNNSDDTVAFELNIPFTTAVQLNGGGN